MFRKVLFVAVTAATVCFLFVLASVVFTDWDGYRSVAEKTQVGCYEAIDHGTIVCLEPKMITSLTDLGENILLGLCTAWVVVLVILPMLPAEEPKIKVIRERLYDNTSLVLDTPPPLKQEQQTMIPGVDH